MKNCNIKELKKPSTCEIITLLRKQALEIASDGHYGWGNTMILAADRLQTLSRAKRVAEAINRG